ncbi:MAG: carboxymuconolactone decarboxylase family protein [Candidatus Heimdallarchaeota archaeon]|nr:carboxymuconolactone decarboxylase family protein [Candidatus Heimdallarchaeota archaeon]
MSNLIPNKDKRNSDADRIGSKLYKENWGPLIENLQSLDPNFAEFVKEIAYGSVYPREQLSLPQREIAAITALTQLNLKPQLKSHIIGALNVGVTKVEILELFLHIAMYIGFPLVLDGLKVANEVFKHYKL